MNRRGLCVGDDSLDSFTQLKQLKQLKQLTACYVCPGGTRIRFRDTLIRAGLVDSMNSVSDSTK
jgi:hypothetical protein